MLTFKYLCKRLPREVHIYGLKRNKQSGIHSPPTRQPAGCLATSKWEKKEKREKKTKDLSDTTAFVVDAAVTADDDHDDV